MHCWRNKERSVNYQGKIKYMQVVMVKRNLSPTFILGHVIFVIRSDIAYGTSKQLNCNFTSEDLIVVVIKRKVER